jgi:hypothetical protein
MLEAMSATLAVWRAKLRQHTGSSDFMLFNRAAGFVCSLFRIAGVCDSQCARAPLQEEKNTGAAQASCRQRKYQTAGGAIVGKDEGDMCPRDRMLARGCDTKGT